MAERHPRHDPCTALRGALVALWLAFVVWGHGPAGASAAGPRDGVIARYWLDDPGSALTPREALAKPWTPFEGALARGITDSTTWVRLAIDPSAAGPGDIATDHRLVLRVQPANLDELAVFRVDRPWEPPIVVGDALERHDLELRSVSCTVVIRDAVAPFELLLRVRSTGNQSLRVQALRWEAAQQLELRQQTIIVSYVVFTLMVLAWAGVAWLAQRDAVLGVFMAHQASMLVLSLALLGMLRLWASDWIPASAIDRLTSVMIPITVGIGIWFHSRLLQDFGSRQPERTALRLMLLGPALALLLVMFGLTRAGLQLTHVTNMVAALLVIVLAWRARSDPLAVRAGIPAMRSVYLVAVYAAMAALTLPPSLRVLGVLSAGPWTFDSFMIYGVVSTVLLGSLLRLRARRAELLSREAERMLLMTERQVALQRARVSEQSELMTMLTHELKTPLSVVSLALGDSGNQPRIRERARRAVENMRDVIDRCAQSARLVDEGDPAEPASAPEPLDATEVLRAAIQWQVQADRIDLRVPDRPPTCRADRQLLLTIVGNLLENAIKYGPPDGRVHVAIEATYVAGKPGVGISVSNPVGPAGRPDPTHLFRKYRRGARAQHQAGSGLGLYLSRQLARRLEGDLTLRDDTDVRFELWLPS